MQDLDKLLLDIGLSEVEIKEYKNIKDMKKQKEYLDKKRKELLKSVHNEEKKITILDFLKYELEKKGGM